MIKVYGCSDDLVEIEGAEYPYDEVGCFEKDVRIEFEDGTVIRVGYPKENLAVWWIEYERMGTASASFDECNDPDADIYSDIFCIDSKVKKVMVIKKSDGKFEEGKKSNFDQLKEFSIEKFADFLNQVETDGRAYGPRGKAAWINWLK